MWKIVIRDGRELETAGEYPTAGEALEAGKRMAVSGDGKIRIVEPMTEYEVVDRFLRYAQGDADEPEAEQVVAALRTRAKMLLKKK